MSKGLFSAAKLLHSLLKINFDEDENIDALILHICSLSELPELFRDGIINPSVITCIQGRV